MKICENCTRFNRHGNGLRGFLCTCTLTGYVVTGRAEGCRVFDKKKPTPTPKKKNHETINQITFQKGI